MSNRLAFQDRELREAGAIRQSAETAAEVRAHSVATAERHYAAHGRRERLLAYRPPPTAAREPQPGPSWAEDMVSFKLYHC